MIKRLLPTAARLPGTIAAHAATLDSRGANVGLGGFSMPDSEGVWTRGGLIYPTAFR